MRAKTGSKLFQILLIVFIVAGFSACNGDEESDFVATFSHEFIDGNHVSFSNTSEGEYYSLTWDFGKGDAHVTTTDKDEEFIIYYPNAGEYTITLTALNYSGATKQSSQTITIAISDLELSFSAEIDPTKPNYVNLENTSQGTYDSFKWLYRDMEIENESTTVAYFPKKGNYQIELRVIKGNDTFSFKQSVSISQDDPDYIENMTLVWADEFDGSAINTSYWTFETGSGGWGNQELQNYTNGSNAEIKDGKLIIAAKKVNDDKVAGSYTSTRMITKGKKEFKYGRIEIRAKLPSGTGIWPAIWMLGSNISSVGWPACGEIDIMEYVGYEPDVIHSTVHTTAGSGGNGNGSSKTLTTCEEEFHVYGLMWTEDELKFYTDSPDNVTHTYAPSNKTADNWPFDQKQFFILNVAVGGTWGGAQGVDNAIFPQTMEVDYVRVYQETSN